MITRRLVSVPGALLLGAVLAGLGPSFQARAAEKTDTWVEVRSPHFTVVSNGSEKQARRVAEHFEQIRAVFLQASPGVRVDPGQPIIILAAKNENTLKALLPEFWERKGHTHPAGLFQPGQEKHYVALRLDATGERPYHTLYHEYVHLLVNLNYRRLPAWLNEGLAEFYGNTTIEERVVGLGHFDQSHLRLLAESRLIPLEVLLKVDRNSPYYNEANRASMFYAESWALVHYLLSDEKLREMQPLLAYTNLLQQEVDEAEAARRAFGDLKQLERKLEEHIRRSDFWYKRMKSPYDLGEKDTATRTLTAAESTALRGDFHLHTGRVAEARALLEQALRLNPNLPLANESMGFLHYRLGEREEAARWFAQAVKLDSQNYLAHYFHAMLIVARGALQESLPEAEASLRRAIELNPNFAPAYGTLASYYSLRKETLEQAFAAARKAVQLEPGEAKYSIQLGQVLLRMERIADARYVGQRALTAAKSPEMQSLAEMFMQQIDQYEGYLAQRKRDEEEARAAREQLAAQLSSEAESEPPAKRNRPTESAQPPPSAAGAKSRRYSAFGRITEVSCASPPAMNLTLNLGGLVMRLYAGNYFKVDYQTTNWTPPANFNPCTHLKGRQAQMSYTLVQGQDYDGEIVSVEVRK